MIRLIHGPLNCLLACSYHFLSLSTTRDLDVSKYQSARPRSSLPLFDSIFLFCSFTSSASVSASVHLLLNGKKVSKAEEEEEVSAVHENKTMTMIGNQLCKNMDNNLTCETTFHNITDKFYPGERLSYLISHLIHLIYCVHVHVDADICYLIFQSPSL